ncbi:MAG: 2,3-bisphosphoglycerate-independent phosphoglycerate mutase [bacterium]|nr:2,3-bisphosphoglycerate-independent phosphoglycerate mutase [bacterium]
MEQQKYNPVVLLIFDGFGIAPPSRSNAVSQSDMQNYTNLSARFPHGQLQASGEAVGLTSGEVGSTEVGHLNLGAGRVVYQDLPRINMSIAEGSFIKLPAFLNTIKHIKDTNGNLHLMGLVSTGNVHASIEHLYALLWVARNENIPSDRIKVHAFLDGRDTSPTSGSMFITQLEEKMNRLGTGKIASISGRYYAMDRDNRWERVEKAYNAIVHAQGESFTNARSAIESFYQKGITDEFIVPSIITNPDGSPIGKVQNGDSVIFFNYRTDRTRELTKAFIIDDFDKMPLPNAANTQSGQFIKTFPRGVKLENVNFATMTDYEKNMPVSGVAFPQEIVRMPLARILSDNYKRHLHIAESEKERFATFFFNGMREEKLVGEERIFIPSPNVPTYDLKPEMSSFEITDALLSKLSAQAFDFAVVNFAASDMVGHTGNLEAAIKACSALDVCLGKIAKAVMSTGGALLLTADHGNVEKMLDSNGGPDTEHSNNPVPLLICASNLKPGHLDYGILADVAPTILALMGISPPDEMTGRNLIAPFLK